MANWKAKRNNNFDKKRKSLYLIEILKIITPEIFLIRISMGIKVIHRPIRTIKRIKSLLTITVTTQRTLNEKNP